MPARSLLYRTRQFVLALWPPVSASGLDAARAALNDASFDLFLTMEKRDQRHGLEVMRRLKATGANDPDLLAAALLHDCGKGSAPVWLRVIGVATPGVVRALAGVSPAAYRLVHHPELGARLAEAAGASSRTVRLIAGTVPPEEEATITLLRSADDAS